MSVSVIRHQGRFMQHRENEFQFQGFSFNGIRWFINFPFIFFLSHRLVPPVPMIRRLRKTKGRLVKRQDAGLLRKADGKYQKEQIDAQL